MNAPTLKTRFLVLTPATLSLALTLPLFGAEPETPALDKRQYNLFNPTPPDLMRELSPDRPDTTESPITLDAGHFAMEVSWFDWSRDGGDDAFTILSSNLKLGLFNDVDIQAVFNVYTWEDLADGSNAEGFGDVQVRLKYNLWGNDSGETALALFPYVQIPTGAELSNGEWEGGLIIPFSVTLTDSLSLGLMAEFDAVYDDTEGEYELVFLHSAVLGISLTERWGTFVEYFGIAGDASYQPHASGGFTFTVNENLILDCGVRVGLSSDSEDLGVFTGFTKRF